MIAATRTAITLSGLIENFVYASLTCKEHQRAFNAAACNRFVHASGADAPADIAAANIEEYLAAMLRAGSSPKTVRNHRGAISAFCSFLRRRGLLDHNPVADVPAPPVVRRPIIILSENECAQALALAQQHGRLAEVAVALYTGLRAGEIRNLLWSDLDLDSDKPTLLVRESKTKKPRIVPVCRPLAEILRRQHREAGAFAWVFPARHTFPGGWKYVNRQRCEDTLERQLAPIRQAMKKFALAGRGTGSGWHLFRHTFVTRAIVKIGSDKLTTIRDWAGHSSVTMTERYLHLAQGYDEAIELLAVGPVDGSR